MRTLPRRFKDSIYEQFARLGKAISAPKRLELLDLLCQGPRTVEALAEQAGISVANASQHLQVLRAARLVETAKKAPRPGPSTTTRKPAGNCGPLGVESSLSNRLSSRSCA